jgi:hypothetical protein
MHRQMTPEDLHDAAELVRGVGRRIDTMDAGWRVDFTREGDRVIQRIRVNDEHAAKASPISLTLRTDFGPQHSQASIDLDNITGFGAQGLVCLPPEVVSELVVTGPEWAAATHRNVFVDIGVHATKPVAGSRAGLRFVDGDGRVKAAFEGEISHVGSGSVGWALEITVEGRAHLKLRTHRDAEGQASLSADFVFEGCSPGQVLRLIRLGQVLRGGYDMQVTVNDQQLGTYCWPEGSDIIAEPAWLQRLHDTAYDLQVVQDHCHVYFPVPCELTKRERVTIRFLRMLIEGRCVLRPEGEVLTGTMQGTAGEVLWQMLSGQPFPISMQFEPVYEVCGQPLSLGVVMYFHPQVTVDDVDEVRADLQASRAKGRTIVLRPAAGQSFRAVLPGIQDPHTPLTVTSLALPGIDERTE